jgi:phosphoglycolate phosphatase-like HAD superfamily hydrolase
VDVDGTMLDVALRHHRVYLAVVEEHGGRGLPLDVYWHLKRSGASWPDVLVRSGLAADEPGCLASFAARIEAPGQLMTDSVVAGMERLLAVWSGWAHVAAVSLRHDHGALTGQLDRLGLGPCLDDVVSAEGGGGARTVKAALVEPFAGAGPVIVIGDTEVDVLAAGDCGAIAIAVTWGIRSRPLLEACAPAAVVDTVDELGGQIERLAPS